MERNTRQRTAIRQAIEAAGRPLLPGEVLELAHQWAPGISQATVYRGLKSLVEDGEITPVTLPSEVTRYEMAGHHHHHHFQCNECQRVFDVHACPGDLSKMAPPGFLVESHDLILYGRCGECLAPASKKATARVKERSAGTRRATAKAAEKAEDRSPARRAARATAGPGRR